MTLSRGTAVALLLLLASTAFAQERPPEPSLSGVVKAVLLDPTTYAPAVVAWEATRLDWRSSQVFFQNGWTEHNSRFTTSGRPDDTAIGYAAGTRKITMDAFGNLRVSAVNNFSSQLVERLLVARYPTHRKLFRVIGWIERSALASYWTYRLSAGHLRQWRENERRARQFGYR
jgi:hypothetical protein